MAEDNVSNVADPKPQQPKVEPKGDQVQPAKPASEAKPAQVPKMAASVVPPAAEQPAAQPQPTQPAAPKTPAPGAVVGGVKVVDPVAELNATRKELPVKTPAQPKGGTAMADVRNAIAAAFEGDSEVTVEARPDHPRGAAVVILRNPDPTRPRAYVNSSDGSWSKKSLTLNLYAFMNSGEASSTQDRVLGALEMTPRQVSTFNRF